MAPNVDFLVALLFIFSVHAQEETLMNYSEEIKEVFKHFEENFDSMEAQLESKYSDRFNTLTDKVGSLENQVKQLTTNNRQQQEELVDQRNIIKSQQLQLDELKTIIMDMDFSKTNGKAEQQAVPNKIDMNRTTKNTTKMEQVNDEPRLNYGEGNVEKRLLVPVATTEIPRSPVIAFSAYMSKNEGHLVDHHILIFDAVQINEGNGYNKHAGTFVVPRSGIYVFTYTLAVRGNGEVCTDLIINDVIYGHVYSYSGTLDVRQKGSSIVVVHVNQGDTVLVRTAIDGACSQSGVIYGDAWRRSTFAGWLIG